MDINDYSMPLKHGAQIQTDATSADIALTEGYEIRGNSSNNGVAVLPSTPFSVTVSVGTVAISAGTVTILADSVVTASRKVYLLGWYVQNNATAFVEGSGSIFTVKNTGAWGSGTTFFSFGTSTATLANAHTASGTPSTYSLNTPYTLGGGGDAGKGLVITNLGTTTSGDAFRITVFGLIQ